MSHPSILDVRCRTWLAALGSAALLASCTPGEAPRPPAVAADQAASMSLLTGSDMVELEVPADSRDGRAPVRKRHPGLPGLA